MGAGDAAFWLRGIRREVGEHREKTAPVRAEKQPCSWQPESTVVNINRLPGTDQVSVSLAASWVRFLEVTEAWSNLARH